ncbi:hypothetical protein EI94DRAFT_506331 [Lactarius quietus]|nr:hypothetical protein EI94DRAFT_506331 [Lactarius quietus]
MGIFRVCKSVTMKLSSTIISFVAFFSVALATDNVTKNVTFTVVAQGDIDTDCPIVGSLPSNLNTCTDPDATSECGCQVIFLQNNQLNVTEPVPVLVVNDGSTGVGIECSFSSQIMTKFGLQDENQYNVTISTTQADNSECGLQE